MQDGREPRAFERAEDGFARHLLEAGLCQVSGPALSRQNLDFLLELDGLVGEQDKKYQINQVRAHVG